MRYSSFLFFIFLFFSFSTLCAQTDTITTRVITFDGDFSQESSKGSKSKFYRNIIKINPLLFIQGDLPIYFERALTSKISIELALGLTTKDYQYGLLRDDIDFGITNDRIKAIPGFSFKSGFRFYPQGYAPEEVYISLEYGYRQYNLEYAKLEEYDLPSGETFRTSRTFNEIKALIGNQNEFYFSNGLFWEYYLGIGLRFIDEIKVEESLEFEGSQSYYAYNLTPKSEVRPAFYYGIKFGVAF